MGKAQPGLGSTVRDGSLDLDFSSLTENEWESMYAIAAKVGGSRFRSE